MAKKSKRPARPVLSEFRFNLTVQAGTGTDPDALGAFIGRLLRLDSSGVLATVAVNADPVQYAKVEWSPEDVIEVHPAMNMAKARDFLEANEKYIREALTARGYEVIEELR